MNKVQKTQAIADLKEQFANSTFFYLTDASSLTVAQINSFRRICYEQNVQMQVVKNTLVKKALESADESKGYSALYEALHGPTAVLFTETANIPANYKTSAALKNPAKTITNSAKPIKTKKPTPYIETPIAVPEAPITT